MLVETLGDQAGRTAPWGIRANGDRGSQERVEPQRRAPSVVLWRRRDVLLKTALFIRGVAVKIRPPGESRIGGFADGGLVKQVARRTVYRTKRRQFNRGSIVDCLVRIDPEGADAGRELSEVVTFYKRSRCKINMRGKLALCVAVGGRTTGKSGVPIRVSPDRNAANNEARSRGI
jgi:hypothetical protein